MRGWGGGGRRTLEKNEKFDSWPKDIRGILKIVSRQNLVIRVRKIENRMKKRK